MFSPLPVRTFLNGLRDLGRPERSRCEAPDFAVVRASFKLLRAARGVNQRLFAGGAKAVCGKSKRWREIHGVFKNWQLDVRKSMKLSFENFFIDNHVLLDLF
jgi:hypothetical protein